MGTHSTATGSGFRTRWAALGAAVAVTLGGGGIGLVSATSPADAVTFVPITPCRVIDTRPAPDNVGTKSTPLGAGEIYTVSAHGDNGNCTGIPTTAAAISLNVTALGATAPTFLTIWANGETQPEASSLNPVPGAPPTPNAVTTDLSATGQFDIYNLQGDVDVLADINGYYVDHDHDDRYYTEGEVDGLLAGLGAEPLLERVIIVQGDGTAAENGARLVDAINTVAAESPTDDDPWAIFLEPGTFESTSFPDLPSYTTIKGSGQEATSVVDTDDGPTFQSAGAVRLTDLTLAQSGTDPTVSFTGTVAMRDLRVVVAANLFTDAGISLNGATATLDNVLVDDGGGTNTTIGLSATNGADVLVDSSEFTGLTYVMSIRDASTTLAVRGSRLDSDNGFVTSLSAGGGTITIDNSVITDQIALGAGNNSIPVDLTIRNSSMERIFFNGAAATAARTVRIENTSMSGGIAGGAGDGLTEAIVRSVTMNGTVSADVESCIGVSTPAGFNANSCP